MPVDLYSIDLEGLLPADLKPMNLTVQRGTKEMTTFRAISEGWKVSGSDVAGLLLRGTLGPIALNAGTKSSRRIRRAAEQCITAHDRDRCCESTAPVGLG